MKANEGTIDRVIRVIAGAVVLYVGIAVVGGTWGIVLDVVAAILIITGAVGFCPLYRLLGGISTKK